jgi:hypothetical protein
MINAIRHSRRPFWMILVFLVALSFSSCKSKKKAMEAQAAEKARLEQEAALRKQQEEDQRQREAEEKAKRDAEAASNKTSAPYARLGQYFDSISKSSSLTSANSSISEALTMFASPDTPVLIVISESNGQKDYDRPTTIMDYLNYLKDQKKNTNKIEKLQFDQAGKITEVELRKN